MNGTREVMANAVAGARDVLGRTAQNLDAENTMTEDEQLRLYETMRGDARALLQFAASRLGPGADVLEEAQRYEEAMERLWTARTGR